MRDIHDEVAERGWSVQQTSMPEFATLVHSLGVARRSRDRAPGLEQLRVIPAEQAAPHSHSARHGTSMFPFHTDTAHWPTPARFMLLRSAVHSNRTTSVVDLASAIVRSRSQRAIGNAVFIVVNGRRSFLVRAWDQTRKLLRFDPSCMAPGERSAERAQTLIHSLLANEEHTDLTWQPGTTLVVDNWRCVHARGEGDAANDEDRLLLRALVETS